MSARKKRKASRRPSVLNRVIWLTFALFVFVGLFGLGTVYLRHEAAVVANENKRLYADISQHKRDIAELGAVLARSTTRDELKKLIATHGLDLGPPSDLQIVHVIEDTTKRLYEKQSDGMLTVSRY